ncbi:unnamed protein product [marine sediment metagenome]|uniref:Uncharacterized protein n=1 Tax=marine sediment metagenome TaxID=412755 RepID=X1KPQ5_9ZZZZ
MSIGTGDVDALYARFAASIIKDKHLKYGAPGIHWNQGFEDRIQVILLTQDNP